MNSGQTKGDLTMFVGFGAVEAGGKAIGQRLEQQVPVGRAAVLGGMRAG